VLDAFCRCNNGSLERFVTRTSISSVAFDALVRVWVKPGTELKSRWTASSSAAPFLCE